MSKLKIAVLLALCTRNAYADDASDARIAKLQKMLEDQQVQMKVMAEELIVLKKQAPAVSAATQDKDIEQEQQWQIQAMSEELKALQQKPQVIVSEKDGIGLKSSNGYFSIKLHGLVQEDYRDIDADTINLATANTKVN